MLSVRLRCLEAERQLLLQDRENVAVAIVWSVDQMEADYVFLKLSFVMVYGHDIPPVPGRHRLIDLVWS